MYEYSAEFYKKHMNSSYNSAYKILNYLNKYISFQSLIDFGCGIGTWCIAAKKLGIVDILGLDNNNLDKADILLDIHEYQKADITKEIILLKKYDIAISMEVAEHIDSSKLITYLNNITDSSDLILFSAAIPGQEGQNHINEQLLSYWVEKFNQYDYMLLDIIRPFFWNDKDIDIWYRNNSVLFVKSTIYKNIFEVFPYLNPPIDIIHPELFQRRINKYKGFL